MSLGNKLVTRAENIGGGSCRKGVVGVKSKSTLCTCWWCGAAPFGERNSSWLLCAGQESRRKEEGLSRGRQMGKLPELVSVLQRV